MKNSSIPASILIGSIILGGFYYATEINKQKSIEKQQQIELQTKIAQVATQEENKKKLDECMSQVHDNFVEEGSSACLELGYSQADIDNLKCKIPDYKLKLLLKTQQDGQDTCIKLYK